MSDEQQIWEAACEKVGVWKRGEFCTVADCKHPESKHKSVGWAARVPHDIPAPAIGDAEAMLKMLTVLVGDHACWLSFRKTTKEWVIRNSRWITGGRDEGIPTFTELSANSSLPLALAAAVLEVKL